MPAPKLVKSPEVNGVTSTNPSPTSGNKAEVPTAMWQVRNVVSKLLWIPNLNVVTTLNKHPVYCNMNINALYVIDTTSLHWFSKSKYRVGTINGWKRHLRISW